MQEFYDDGRGDGLFSESPVIALKEDMERLNISLSKAEEIVDHIKEEQASSSLLG